MTGQWSWPPPGWPAGEPWPPGLAREPDPVTAAERLVRRRWRWWRWAPRRVLRRRTRRMLARRAREEDRDGCS